MFGEGWGGGGAANKGWHFYNGAAPPDISNDVTIILTRMCVNAGGFSGSYCFPTTSFTEDTPGQFSIEFDKQD